MKFSVIKNAVAIATIAAASAASAAAGDTLTLTSGTGLLTFSTAGVGALGTVGVNVAALPGSGTTGSVAAGFSQSLTLLTSGSTTLTPGSSANIAGASVTSLTFGTGGVQLLDTFDGSNVASLTNFSFDVASKTLFSDVKIGAATTSTRYALYTATTLDGPTTIPTDLGTATVTNQVGYAAGRNNFNLKLGNDFADAIGAYLGLDAGVIAFTKTVNFGTLDSSLTGTITAAVPEPSTYALMGLGLAGAAFVARRRAAK